MHRKSLSMEQSYTCNIWTKLFSFEIPTYRFIRSNVCPFKIRGFRFSRFIIQNKACFNLTLSRCFQYILHFKSWLFSSSTYCIFSLHFQKKILSVGFTSWNTLCIHLTVYFCYRTMRLIQCLSFRTLVVLPMHSIYSKERVHTRVSKGWRIRFQFDPMTVSLDIATLIDQCFLSTAFLKT